LRGSSHGKHPFPLNLSLGCQKMVIKLSLGCH